ncbi:MAG: potassium channel family protein, partial [Candidatus Dormibacteraceae bacterium]
RRQDHAVVIGLGTVGYRISQLLLDAGLEVVALDSGVQNPFIIRARGQGIPVLVGDARFRDNLGQLSIESARVVVAATDDDLVNLESALMAKEVNDQIRVVARLFDPALADRAHLQLGIDVCLSLAVLAAPAFVAAAIGEGILSTLERGGRLWLLAQREVEEGSKLEGFSLGQLEEGGDVQVLAHRAGGSEEWAPDRKLQLGRGN